MGPKLSLRVTGRNSPTEWIYRDKEVARTCFVGTPHLKPVCVQCHRYMWHGFLILKRDITTYHEKLL